MDEKSKELTEVVRRVSNAEQQAINTINQLLLNGVDNLNYNREKNEIKATTSQNGVVNSQTIRFDPICQELHLMQVNVTDKEARNSNIVKMFEDGVSQAEIARRHGISQARVHGILKEAGVL